MKSKNHSENKPPASPQSDPYQKRSVLWIVLIMFISGWMFFLGVIVGRGTAPAMFDYQKIETEIAVLTKTFMESRKTKNDLDSDILATQAELEYPEELKKKTEDPARMLIPTPPSTPTPAPTQKPSPVSPIPEKPPRPADTPKPVRHEPAPGTQPPPVKSEMQAAGRPETVETAPDAIRSASEGKIRSMYDIRAQHAKETAPEKTVPAVAERTPAAVPRPQPPASDIKPAPAAQPVTVQMPSLMDRQSADALIESLRSKGISASKSPKMIQGKGVWYTVVIGKYASSTEADAIMNRLKQVNVDAVKQ
jgi:septal ring-binding cell division protein DamX